METEIMATNNQNLYISPVVGMDEAKAKFEQVRQFTADCLTKGVDYGYIEGVKKATLLKPGAEKISTLFGLTPKFTCTDKIMNWNGEGNSDYEPFFYFEYKCELYKNGEYVSSCVGSCNSWEKKYRYRKGELICPNCGKPLRRSKNKDEFYCWTKTGGCGATFPTNDPRVSNQKVGDVKNFDTAEQVNTFQKMAQKRAFIGAVLIACNLSEYYTQDIEDMASFAVSEDVPPMVEGSFEPVYEPAYESVPVQPAQPVQPVQPAQQQKQRVPFNEIEFLKQWRAPEGVTQMSRINAEKMTDSNGQPYGEKTTEALFNMLRVITKKISTLTDEQKPDYQIKVSAICEILQCRKIEKTGQPDIDPFVNQGTDDEVIL